MRAQEFLQELFDRPVKNKPATARTRSRFVSQVGEREVEVFFKNTDRGLEINFGVDGRGFALERERGNPDNQRTLTVAINMILNRLPEAVAYYRPKRVWYKSIGTDAGRVKLYNRLLPVLQRALGPEWRASTEQHPGWTFYYLDRKQKVDEARIPRAIEEFLDSLVPSDCGVEEIGAYSIHFEGFTSDCKSSADYRRDPEAVYQQVYQDFIQREGGARPLVQDMVGDEDFPILYSIFRKRQPIREAQQATAKQVLSYINKTHHEPFEPGSKMYKAVLAHPRWELVQVPLLNLNIPDQEYDDVDYYDNPPESDPYDRVMTVEPEHAGEVSAHLVDKKPIVIDTDRYIIDGNHRAWAAKYLLNRDYIQAWRPVEQLQEYRQGPMELLRRELPGWPDYVIKDMIYAKLNTPGDLTHKLEHVRELASEARSWRLMQKMPLTFNMLDSGTQSRMKQRKFGDANPFKVPNDRDRFEHALALVKEKGMENLPPVIFRQTPQGLELWEGWHRTMAAFRLNPKGFKINAWIGTP